MAHRTRYNSASENSDDDSGEDALECVCEIDCPCGGCGMYGCVCQTIKSKGKGKARASPAQKQMQFKDLGFSEDEDEEEEIEDLGDLSSEDDEADLAGAISILDKATIASFSSSPPKASNKKTKNPTISEALNDIILNQADIEKIRIMSPRRNTDAVSAGGQKAFRSPISRGGEMVKNNTENMSTGGVKKVGSARKKK
jgi:hypothetical protein